ncbi:NUDIX domain-containing protein [Bacillus gibsonii]|jgi:8-oxo-dGTP diphosphatase|uniref:NUDIX hydrolase n=2 Tax=Alkalicoccobacillus gibsonii TaxID=79881 RepID=UPI001934A525|nr:NUDIX domain-containing protein [Alkalicoccobacillus gibsonii]MBM0067477.1 NUDIX domain-containing protein [Alkalicoccobacillus gibsonii]
MRDRGSIVLMKDHKVALIKRIKGPSTYYVFPGGGIEEQETPEVAAVREAFEELGLEVRIKELVETVEWQGTQYFYLAEVVSGTFGTGCGLEYISKVEEKGRYVPLWIPIDDLPELDVRPREVVRKILELNTSKHTEPSLSKKHLRDTP